MTRARSIGDSVCTIENCTRIRICKNMCDMHYRRFRICNNINKVSNDSLWGMKAHHHTDELKKRLSELKKEKYKGEGNPNYGKLKDNIKYKPLHAYIRKYLPKPQLCTICNLREPNEVHNISAKYLRDLSDWQWLCHKCHMTIDGRLDKLIEIRKKNVI